MEDRTFVLTCGLIAICVCTLIGAVGYVSVQKQKAMTDMVVKGANPIAVHCAMDGVNTSNQAVCQALASSSQSVQVNK